MHAPLLSRIHPFAVVATLLLVFSGSDAADIGNSTDLGSSTTTANRRPSITGTPPATVVVGQAYSFRPKASDADGQKLSFAISRKPSWAKFDIRTGRLYGRPAAANIGTYKNIRIAVSDGMTSTYLGPFRIDVKAAAASTSPEPITGSATLRWTAPTRNEDGSALTNLAGYRVHYGTNRNSLTNLVQVNRPNITQATVGGLTTGTWYFMLTSYTNTGVESGPSVTASKTIP